MLVKLYDKILKALGFTGPDPATGEPTYPKWLLRFPQPLPEVIIMSLAGVGWVLERLSPTRKKLAAKPQRRADH